MVDDEADESATAGASADTDLSGRGIIDTTINIRTEPAGSVIQPADPAAGMMRRRICWARDFGRGGEGCDGASPCHNHKPDSLLSVLIKTAFAEAGIGAPSAAIVASLYAWPIATPCSASIAHDLLPVAAVILVHFRAAPLDALSTASGSKPPPLVGDGIEQAVFWRATSATAVIIVSK
jgi:hypothetical protein